MCKIRNIHTRVVDAPLSILLWQSRICDSPHILQSMPTECNLGKSYETVWLPVINLTTVFWGLFRSRRPWIVPNFVIGLILLLFILVILCINVGIQTDIWFSCCQINYVFVAGRSVRVWGLKRTQKTGNVSIFETVVRLNMVQIVNDNRMLCWLLHVFLIPCVKPSQQNLDRILLWIVWSDGRV